MGSPTVLDFDALLAEIAGDLPTGADLRTDYSPRAIYRVLKDARAAARATERNVVWEEEPDQAQRADWSALLQRAPEVLATQSKDLEIVAWLTEALVREYGFAGLRDGFRLARELVEHYWEGLYPAPDEEGVSTRVAPLAGLNGVEAEGALITPLTNVFITGGQSVGPFHLADYRQAVEVERIEDPDKRALRLARGAASMQNVRQAVAETPEEYFATLSADLDECLQEFDKLDAALDEKCGRDETGHSLAPPSSNIRSVLQNCREALDALWQPNHELTVTEENGAAGALVADGNGNGLAVPGSSQVRTREDAFRALLQVAAFFKKTEPHSPISYSLEQAVRWGRMSLPDLLTELIPEMPVREQLFKLVGIRTESSNSSE